MKIAVCFKLIPDYDQVPAENWRAGGLFRSKAGFSGAEYVKKVFSFFDEGALESALRVKDDCPSAFLEAISLGAKDETYTRALIAAGFDKVTFLEADSDFDSENTAKVLAGYIANNSFDAVFCGESAGPLNSKTVPFLMARNLNCPIIDKLSEVNEKDGSLILTRECPDKAETYEVKADAKCIAVFSDAAHPYLRFSSYERKEKTKHIQANCIKAVDGKANVKFAMPNRANNKAEFIDKEKLFEMLKESKGGSI